MDMNFAGMKFLVSAVFLSLFFFSGCGPGEPDAEKLWQTYFSGAESYPDLELLHPLPGTLFPPEMPAPRIIWNKDSAAACDSWLIAVSSGNGNPVCLNITSFPNYRLPEDKWEIIKKRFAKEEADLTVLGFQKENPGEILASGKSAFMISTDPVEAPIFYREVNLPFKEAVKDPTKIRWRFGTIDSLDQPPVVLDNLPVCGNCHSFSSDGAVLGMDVDYANDKGAYAITEVEEEISLSKDKIISWTGNSSRGSEKSFGLLSQVSPDGRYVLSTVRDRSVFVPKDDLAFSQLFFPLKGVIEVYDREKKVFYDLPGASDPKYVQSNPSWSPDGKYIVFARSKAYELKTLDDQGKVVLTPAECVEFLVEGRKFKFELFRVPFNNGRGGKAEPLQGASGNGLSNYFAKYSPDGKWIIFCQAESYMLLQPDSQLFIIPAAGGEPRKIASNTGRMNSWHSWSPNSRWIVFSSKAFSDYTQLMIAHIGEDGIASPAVLLDRMTVPDRAANIPEFVNIEPGSIHRIVKNFVDDNSLYRAGFEFNRANEPESAEFMFRKALELNPDNLEAHLSLSYLLSNRGVYDEAISHLEEVIRLEPRLAKARSNLGYVYMRKGNPDEAFGCFSEAVRLNPNLTEAHLGMGVLRLKQGDFSLAEKRFRTVLEQDTGNIPAGVGLAKALRYQGQKKQALALVIDIVRREPGHVEALLETGEMLAEEGRLREALLHFNRVLSLSPGDARALQGKNSAETAINQAGGHTR